MFGNLPVRYFNKEKGGLKHVAKHNIDYRANTANHFPDNTN